MGDGVRGRKVSGRSSATARSNAGTPNPRNALRQTETCGADGPFCVNEAQESPKRETATRLAARTRRSRIVVKPPLERPKPGEAGLLNDGDREAPRVSFPSPLLGVSPSGGSGFMRRP
jgi:hypothetical protein